MDARVPKAQKVVDSSGIKVVPHPNEYFRKYMVMDFVMDAACLSGSATFFISRYPFSQVDS